MPAGLGHGRGMLVAPLVAGVVGGAAWLPILAPGTAYAEPGPIVVTTTDDSGAGSLRAALAEAGATPEDDRITFAPPAAGRLLLTSGALEATVGPTSGNLTIEGPGADVLTIDADGRSRILDVGGPGGDLRPQLTVSGLTLTRGGTPYGASYGDDDGGALRVVGTDVQLDRMTVSDSSAGHNGGGVAVAGGSLAVARSTIRHNAATSGGGYGDNSGGGVFVDPEGAAGVRLEVRDSTISDNRTDAEGGGIASRAATTVTGSTVSGNEAYSVTRLLEAGIVRGAGGGIAAGDLTVIGSTIADNAAASGGGVAGTTVVIRGSTLARNRARQGAGGGIAVDGDARRAGHLQVIETTVAENWAQGVGGAVHAGQSTAVEATSSTIARNAAAVDGGLWADSEVLLDNTVLAGNTGGDLAGGGSGSLDHSLVQEPRRFPVADAGGSILGEDARLGPLADNGGPTPTMLPAPNAPIVDTGDALGMATDQRGSARPAAAPDMGAVELTAAERAEEPQVGVLARPLITGRPEVGQVLRVSGGSWEPRPDSVSYQWLRDGVPIDGAYSSSYVVRVGDLDFDWYGEDLRHRLSARVAARAAGYRSATAATDATAFVRRGRITMAGAPAVRGRLAVGSVLRARPRLGSVVPPSSHLAVQWIVGGRLARLPGPADPLALPLTRQMRGDRVRVRFSYGAEGYRPLTKVVRLPGRIR